MKKIILLLIMALILSGCGGERERTFEQKGTVFNIDEGNYRILMIKDGVEEDIVIEEELSFEEAEQKYGGGFYDDGVVLTYSNISKEDIEKINLGDEIVVYITGTYDGNELIDEDKIEIEILN